MRSVKDMESEAKRIMSMSPQERAEHDRKLEEYQTTLMIADELVGERMRAKEVEGWTIKHDDQHDTGELADAAAVYAMSPEARVRYENATDGPKHWPPRFWPWEMKWWKPKDRRRDLVRAGGLIIAEIERIDRKAAKEASRK